MARYLVSTVQPSTVHGPMRIGVISDVHSNLAALEAVLAELGSVDQLWCLGDIVGYGPQPNECIARLAQAGVAAVAGNHDWAAIGRMDVDWFNADAAAALEWTAAQLTPQSRDFLASLPEKRLEGEFTLVHGSPRQPIVEYVLSAEVAAENFPHLATRVCLVGHTHIPASFADSGADSEAYMGAGTRLRWGGNERRYILNPGSVGQPRDDDPRAAYMVLDTDLGEATWQRVAYPITSTQEQMTQCGLPRRLVVRLSHGW